jgi:hypothetical protein
LESELQWAYTSAQSTEVLVIFNADGATRGYAILSSANSTSPDFTYTDSEQELTIEVQVTFSTPSQQQGVLQYKGKVTGQQPPPTPFSGTLATFSMVSSSVRATAGTKR